MRLATEILVPKGTHAMAVLHRDGYPEHEVLTDVRFDEDTVFSIKDLVTYNEYVAILTVVPGDDWPEVRRIDYVLNTHPN